MTRDFPELVVGGILIAPFVTYAAMALILFFLLRPVLRRGHFERFFSNPPIALLCVYVTILAFLVVVF